MIMKIFKNVAILMVTFFVVGCGSSSNDENHQTQEVTNLSKWQGEWRSVNSALENEGMSSFYENIANSNPTYSPNGIKVGLSKNLFGSRFSSLKIADSKIVYPVFDSKTKTFTDQEVAYKYEGKVEQSGKTLYKFVSTNDDKYAKAFKYVLLMQPHAKEGENFKHWHFLYSSQGFDKIKFSPLGYKPIYVDKGVTDVQLVDFFKARADKIKTMFEPSLQSWNGEWVSLSSLIEDNSAEVDGVYTKLINEFKDQKVFTKEEAKLAFHNFMTKDFDAYEVKIQANNITFIKDTQTQNYDYILDGTQSAGGHGSWITFTTKDITANNFTNLLLSVVHGNPLEFHAKANSLTYEEISKTKGVPTFFKKPIDKQELLHEFEIFGRIALKQALSK